MVIGRVNWEISCGLLVLFAIERCQINLYVVRNGLVFGQKVLMLSVNQSVAFLFCKISRLERSFGHYSFSLSDI